MKYIGSKNKIAKDIVPIIQKYIDDSRTEIYIEPFVGGFNVIDKIKCKYRYASDIDSIVIDLVDACIRNPELLNSLPILPTREHYNDVKDNEYKYDKWYRSAILLFASYNAKVYGGGYGAFAKTKDGNIRNYFKEAKSNFEKQLPNLDDITILTLDYKKAVNCNNAVIYCDIPYKNGIGYKTDFNHNEFYEWCKIQSSNGNIVLISEYEMPSDFKCIWSKDIKVHLNNRNKIDKTEKLFTI